jgi:hypothetical protein
VAIHFSTSTCLNGSRMQTIKIFLSFPAGALVFVAVAMLALTALLLWETRIVFLLG